MNIQNYKQKTQEHWGENPCGSNYSTRELLTSEYFHDIERHRYGTHPWLKELINNQHVKNKKMLEVGFGMGTDHLQFARKGALMHGIDITPRNLTVAKKLFSLRGYKSNFITGDAEHLPYSKNEFNFVYSFGVLHHTPSIEKALKEIKRVLKPGGKAVIGLYHRHSFFYFWSLFIRDWILKGDFLKETFKQRLSRIEYPGTDQNLLVNVYSKRSVKKLMKDFKNTELMVRHLTPHEVFNIGTYLPKSFINKLSTLFGWYVIAIIQK